MKTDIYYNRLNELRLKYPALTFENEGYQYISKEVREAHKEPIEEIEAILRKTFEGFSKFKNFKTSKKTGKPVIRLDYNYNYDGKGIPFIGVGYFHLEIWKDYEIEKKELAKI